MGTGACGVQSHEDEMFRPTVALLLKGFVGGLLSLSALSLPVSGQERWGLREEFRIGALDGPGSITRVGDVLTSADGRLLYVSQPAEKVVKVFDAKTGGPVRSLGRAGRGPGEFQRVGGLSVRGDSVFVSDPLQQRMVKFSGSGEHLETFKVIAPPVVEVSRPPMPFKVTSRGDLWVQFFVNVAAVAHGSIQEWPYLIMTRSGEIVRRVASVSLTGTMTVAEFEGGVAMFVQPFKNPLELWDVASDGSAAALATVDQQRSVFWVTRFNEVGDTVFHRGYRYRPKKITAEVHDSVVSEMATTLFRRAGPRARAVAEEHVEIPEHFAPVSDVVVDALGRTWIRREASGLAVSWVALDEAGTIEGIISTPAGLSIHHADGDVVWGVIRDDFDVPYVVRFRLVSKG